MIFAGIQLMAGLIAFCVCVWSFAQARQLARANQRLGLNGSTGMTVATMKRREVIHALVCLLVMTTSMWATWYWYDIQENDPVFLIRSGALTSIAVLIMVNTIWDAVDRHRVLMALTTEQGPADGQNRHG